MNWMAFRVAVLIVPVLRYFFGSWPQFISE
jgi:hypothetical protein